MVALVITSTKPGAGKTTITAGLGKYLVDSGKKAGYLKLASTTNDTDVLFMKGLLNLGEPLEKLVFSPSELAKAKEIYAEVSHGKDIMLIEAPGKDASWVAETLDAKVITVEGATTNLDELKGFGKRLVGMVINKVPSSQLIKAKEQAAKLGAGLKVLGLIAEDRALLAVSVGELANAFKGKVLDGESQLSELVENIMFGALYLDSGIDYFGRKSNKAVVLRSERADMQLAALETSTRCMVLVGDKPPANIVLQRAKEKKVPVVLAAGDVTAAVATIEKTIVESRFGQIKKLPRLVEIMKKDLDFMTLNRELGLAG